MTEPQILADFTQCPMCEFETTISQKALEVSGKESPGFASTRKEVVPLEQPALANVTISIIILHFDVCANCGTEYCTRAELQQAPVQFKPKMPPGQGGLGGPNPYRGLS